jgi:hypothetical protein
LRHPHSRPPAISAPSLFSGVQKVLFGITALGLCGLTADVCLIIFPLRLFPDTSYRWGLSLPVFLCCYGGVIAGCSWWLKAKGWHDAVAFIGLAPLAFMFIPYVRLILIREPLIILPATLFASLLLIVVVFTLSDKSGVFRRSARSSRREHN